MRAAIFSSPCSLSVATLALVITFLSATLTPTGAATLGIAYGRDGNNLPPPREVVDLYRSQGIKGMRIYYPDQEILQALRGSDMELLLGVPNTDLQQLAYDTSSAKRWVQTNVLNYFPDVKIKYIAVGNEVTPVNGNSQYAPFLVAAMTNIFNAILDAGLFQKVLVSTALDTSVIGTSYPPSAGNFRGDVMWFMNPVIGFLTDTRAPIMFSIYPYFSYIYNPSFKMSYALFTNQSPEFVDNGLPYYSLFDAMLDGVHSALDRAGGSGLGGVPSVLDRVNGSSLIGVRSVLETVNANKMRVVVTESGWPSKGKPRVFTPPSLEGGNIVITLDEEDIEAEEKECVYDVIGRISYQKGDRPLSTVELLKKLSSLWGMEVLDLSYIGNGFYHVFLRNYIWQSNILSRGTLNLKPGMFRVQRWVSNFDPWSFKQTHAQVWMRIFCLPMEYRGKLSLLRIAHGAGTPLRIDEKTQRRGQYSRVLIDFDCSRLEPPKELLVKREKMGINFFVPVSFESLPDYCSHCRMIGHSVVCCRKLHGDAAKEPMKRVNYRQKGQEIVRKVYVEKQKENAVNTSKNVEDTRELDDDTSNYNTDIGEEEVIENVNTGRGLGDSNPLRINWADLVEEDESAHSVPDTSSSYRQVNRSSNVSVNNLSSTMFLSSVARVNGEKEQLVANTHNAEDVVPSMVAETPHRVAETPHRVAETQHRVAGTQQAEEGNRDQQAVVINATYMEAENQQRGAENWDQQAAVDNVTYMVAETQQREAEFTMVLSKREQQKKNKERKIAENNKSMPPNTRGRWGDIDLDAIDNRHRYEAYEEEPDLPSPLGMKIGSPISSALKKKLQKKIGML